MSAVRSKVLERAEKRLEKALTSELRQRGLPFDVSMVAVLEDGSSTAVLSISLGTKEPADAETIVKAWLDRVSSIVSSDLLDELAAAQGEIRRLQKRLATVEAQQALVVQALSGDHAAEGDDGSSEASAVQVKTPGMPSGLSPSRT